MKKSLVLVWMIIILMSSSIFGQTEVSGDVWGVWDASGSPYLVTGDVHVPTDSSLSIMPGCSVIFQGHYRILMDYHAVLIANGTATDMIVFTALDTHLTDSSGGHAGLVFYCMGSWISSISYCLIEYGNGFPTESSNGKGGAISGGISGLTITNNIITRNRAVAGGGIYCCGEVSISNNLIEGNIAKYHGGGIYCSSGSPIISNNIIVNNSTEEFYGGGIYCNGCSPTITYNTIADNQANHYGGGICLWYRANGSLTNNLILNNTANYASGGGIYSHDSKCSLIENTITGNVTPHSGGGIYCDNSSNMMLSSNKISGNSAGDCGGGIFFNGGFIRESTSSLVNNIIHDNAAYYYGGAIYCAYSSIYIINSTVTGNYAGYYGGGIFSELESKIVIFNSIFWNDSSNNRDEIFLGYFGGSPCSVYITYSNIDSSRCYLTDETNSIVWGEGNINSNPLFMDTLFHLGSESPCLDAGLGSIYIPLTDTVLYAPNVDFEGDSRPYGLDPDDCWEIGADESYFSKIYEEKKYRPEKMEISVYPNPFNSRVKISTNMAINIEIFNMMGRKIGNLVPFSTRSDTGIIKISTYIWKPEPSVKSGIYLLKATYNNHIITGKIVYLK